MIGSSLREITRDQEISDDLKEKLFWMLINVFSVTYQEFVDSAHIQHDYNELAKRVVEHTELIEAAECIDRRFIILADAYEVVGYVEWYCPKYIIKHGFITSLYIRPEHQRKGYGSRLLERVFETLKEQGILICVLHAEKSNETSRHFYCSHGFHSAGAYISKMFGGDYFVGTKKLEKLILYKLL